MDDSGYGFLVVVIIILFAILLAHTIKFFEGVSSNSKFDQIGQMICDEKGYGAFRGFDKYTDTIECYPKENTERYDGGYIKVVR